ncbi:MAG TPA: YciI family protein [Kineosporiaceae bacterium]|nr:YciI family protein [Kineosporiaceae bacterium]
MTQYMILIYENEAAYESASPELWTSMLDAHNAFAKAVGDLGGTILGGNALQPTPTATSVRSGDVTDGPFVETKEALGGYYLIEARDLDHALQIAKLCPAPNGGVELRPIMDTSGDAGA